MASKMKVTVNTNPEPSEELITMISLAEFWGSKGEPIPNGVIYRVTQNRVTQVQFDILMASSAVTLEDYVCYVKVEQSIMDNLVDVDMPDCRYFDDEGVEHRRVYEEYAPWQYPSNDGTWVMMRCCHVPHTGPKCGVKWTEEEMMLWQSEIGALICENEFNRLRATPEWKPAEGAE